jgi:hypothetical protein
MGISYQSLIPTSNHDFFKGFMMGTNGEITGIKLSFCKQLLALEYK